MNRVDFWTLLFDISGWIFIVLGGLASIRALLALVSWSTDRIKRMSRLTVAESFLILLLAIAGGAVTELYSLGVKDGIYWAKDVERRLGRPTVTRRKPEGQPTISGLPYREQPEWMSEHIYWLEKEGDRDKEKGIIASYAVSEIAYSVPFSTIQGELKVYVPEPYSVWGRIAFRETRHGNSTLSERLKVTPSSGFRILRVSIPQSEEGDRLFILVRVSSNNEKPPKVEEVIKASFE